MRSRGCNACVLALAAAAVFFGTDAARAQLPDPPATTQDALRQMFDQAGVVFTGQVVAVRHINPAGGATGVIEIDFAVTDAIHGVVPGGLYTLREWAGLAPAGNLTYQPGQRYLMLLHAPGPSGLSSPVGGTDGAIPIRGSGPAAGPNAPDLGTPDPGAVNPAAAINLAAARSPAHTTFKMASSTAIPSPASITDTNPDTRTVDLRWIATRVLQPLSYLPDSVATLPARPVAAYPNPERPNTALAAAAGQNTILAPPPGTASPADATSAPNQSAAYAVILALLQSWEQDDHAAR